MISKFTSYNRILVETRALTVHQRSYGNSYTVKKLKIIQWALFILISHHKLLIGCNIFIALILNRSPSDTGTLNQITKFHLLFRANWFDWIPANFRNQIRYDNPLKFLGNMETNVPDIWFEHLLQNTFNLKFITVKGQPLASNWRREFSTSRKNYQMHSICVSVILVILLDRKYKDYFYGRC